MSVASGAIERQAEKEPSGEAEVVQRLLRGGACRLDRRRTAAAGSPGAETSGAVGPDHREPGPGGEQGRASAPRTGAIAAVVAAWAGADDGVVAAGTGDLPLGQAGGAFAGEQGEATGQAGATRAVGCAEQDTPGGGPGPRTCGGGAIAAVREGDEELLERAIPLLRRRRTSLEQTMTWNTCSAPIATTSGVPAVASRRRRVWWCRGRCAWWRAWPRACVRRKG